MTVYFIQSGNEGPIKIGLTEGSVSKRLANLQTGNPVELNLLLEMNGGRELEAQLHNRFAALRFRNEWFYPAHELIDYINSQYVVPPLVEIETDDGPSESRALLGYLSNNQISMQRFAQSIGTTRQTIYRICHNQNEPSPQLARQIVKATGGSVSLQELFGVAA